MFKFRVAGHKGSIQAGFYPDGRLGEVFVTMDGEGSAVGGLMNAWSAAISIGLQYGTPLAAFVAKFAYAKFEPFGVTGDPDVKMAQSLIDYVIRKLDACYPGGQRSDQKKKQQSLQETLDRGEVVILGPATKNNALEAGCSTIPVVMTPTLRADTAVCACGHLAYRRGSCYCCDTCGTTSGCG